MTQKQISLETGSQSSGKSTICSEIIKRIEKTPFNCYVEIFFCALNKARKVYIHQIPVKIPT